jgi:hypothetical protein
VAVAVVLAVVALGLVLGVSLFGSHGGGNGVSSSSALGHAAGVASAHGAGVLVLETGVSTTFSFSYGKVTGNTSCPVTDPLATNFTVPSATGGYSSGDATLWLFLYANSTGPSESVVAVVGSTAYFLGQVTGSTCVSSTSFLPIPAGTVDSTTAAGAFDQDAGSFLSAHSSANAVYALVNNSTEGPEWLIAYTNCSYDPANNTTSGGDAGDLDSGIVNGTTGTLITSNFDSDLNCSGLNLANVSLNLGAGTPVPALSPAGSTIGPAGFLQGPSTTARTRPAVAAH